MRKNEFQLDQILAELQSSNNDIDQNVWDPGFSGGRRVVISKLGPYTRFFPCPDQFIKRFYHTVYTLPIDNWRLEAQTQLYGGFCKIDTQLDIRFQSSVKFAKSNMDVLPDVNEYIKTCFEGLILDIVYGELLKLDGGDWVNTGLSPVEKEIEKTINETLIVQHVQCRAVCELKPSFEEVAESDGLDEMFVSDSVYHNVLKKSFEFKEKQKQELFRQEQALEQIELDQKRKRLEQLDQENEIQRQRLAKEAENLKRQLLDKEEQHEEQYSIESLLHAKKLEHENRLKAMSCEVESQEKEKQQLKSQQIEEQLLENELKHKALLKEQELESEIQEYEKRQTKWNETEARLKDEKLKVEEKTREQELEADIMEQEIRMTAQQKMDERLQEEKLRHETRLRDMELEAEIQDQQKRFEATKKSDDFLRREIELLVMEKQKAELSQAIKNAEDDSGKERDY